MTSSVPASSLLVALSSLALVVLGPVVPAQASPAQAGPVQALSEACRAAGPAAEATRGRVPDTSAFTREELRDVDQEIRRTDGSRAATYRQARTSGVIDVHIHVIGSKAARGPKRTRVDRQMSVLTEAYAAGQSPLSAVAPFTFQEASFERVRNSSWHRARPGSSADREMRQELHRGGRDALNVYVLAPRLPRSVGPGTLLGWSTLPWQVHGKGVQDGISVHKATLPGSGSSQPGFVGFDSGDTLVHESGHWLGLLHTFEGGCTAENDFVEDTPAQATASVTCVVGTDTCELPGEDPVRNFMDYAPDDCMDMFTAGQVERMAASFVTYRAPTT
ncbi:MAG: zinc metalloprotease [Nocardioidaceae bacterium]|nr:zinc metalloprotease [Nocardioidaceae bacterium]